jgi:hypothetical protein
VLPPTQISAPSEAVFPDATAGYDVVGAAFHGRALRGGGSHGELDVSRHPDPIARKAEKSEPVGVEIGLDARQRDRAEDAAHERPDEAIAPERAVADPAVDDDHGNGAGFGLEEQVRPELGLDQDEERGLDRVHRAPHRRGKIERGVGDLRETARSRLREPLSRSRHRREEEESRGALHELPPGAARDADLPDRGGLDPEAAPRAGSPGAGCGRGAP